MGSALWAEYMSQMKPGRSDQPDAEHSKNQTEAIELARNRVLDIASRGNEPHPCDRRPLSCRSLQPRGRSYEKAIAVLEREAIGPLTLVESNDPSADRTGYAATVYRTALQSYVLVSPPRREEVEQLTDALDSAMCGDAESEKKLLQIYIGLGLQLQRQLTALRENG